MQVTVAFPWRDGRCQWRRLSFPHVRQAYAEILPEARQIVADSGHQIFNRAATRNEGVRQAGNGVVVLADTDILPDRDGLLSAIEAARQGGFHIGFTLYRALRQVSTQAYYARRTDPARLPHSHTADDCTAGLIVIRTDEWWRAGGMDERFSGWGWEDSAFACAVRTILGPIQRHAGTANHLWHPTECKPRSECYQMNKRLYERYAAAEGDRMAMQSLIEERKCVLHS